MSRLGDAWQWRRHVLLLPPTIVEITISVIFTMLSVKLFRIAQVVILLISVARVWTPEAGIIRYNRKKLQFITLLTAITHRKQQK